MNGHIKIYFFKRIQQLRINRFVVYNSSHVRLPSLKNDSSPQLIKRGYPSTQVMRCLLSPGIAYRGNGQKRAAGEPDSTFDGHLKPTTAAIQIFDNLHLYSMQKNKPN